MSSVVNIINAVGSSVKIGQPVRQETEFQYGETIRLLVKVPGGTTGRTFISNFQHELAGKSNQPVGQVQGSFAVAVLDRDTVELSSVSDGLALGRYLFDISYTDGTVRSTSSPREFLLQRSLSGSAWSSTGDLAVLPPVNTYPELVELHNDNLDAHNGLLLRSQQFTVGDSDLLGAHAILTHELSTTALSVTVSDSSGELSLPWYALNLTTVQVDFTGLTPLLQQYTVLLVR